MEPPTKTPHPPLQPAQRPPMRRAAATIIRAEHAALSAVLYAMQQLVADHRHNGTPLDFATLRAMIFYVDEFPEQRHHRKESERLFPKLRARTLLARSVLDRLDEEHARGGRRIRELEHTLLAFEVLGESRRDAFEQALQRYVEFYLAHMRLEETEVLPLAEKVLTDEDWADLDEAFSGDRDGLAGQEPDAEYHALFRRIVHHVSAPLGLGEAPVRAER